MLVSGGKIRKKIEDKFDFKFKSLKIIGYFNKNKDSYGKSLNTIICKDRKNVYMIEVRGTKIEIIKKLQYISVDNTTNAFIFFFNGEKFYYKYRERIVLAYDVDNEEEGRGDTKVNYINGSEIEILYVGEEELRLTDEEMVILKLDDYFIDEKKLFGN